MCTSVVMCTPGVLETGESKNKRFKNRLKTLLVVKDEEDIFFS
jgi:hypothetical protein